ncbi:MAG TPA: C45 family peptidase [Pirellulales bacterium]
MLRPMDNLPQTQPKLDVTCSGAPYEMGFAQGAALRERIQLGRRELSKLEAFRNEQPWWMPYPVFLAYAERKVAGLVRPGVAAAFPEMQQRLEGIAAGAAVPLNALYLLNGLEALMASVEGKIQISALAAACSAIAVRGSRSQGGQPVIARNFDYLPIVQPFYAIRRCEPTGGMRSLEFTLAPLAGTVDGVNEAGLCITYNYAFTLDRPGKKFGFISMAISEAMARCRTVAEAAEWISSRPRWGGGILMLADAAGDIASLELSSTQATLRRPVSGANVIYHTNCFFEPTTSAAQVPAGAVFTDRAPKPIRGRRVLESADVRRNRFEELLSPQGKFSGPLGPNDLQAILSDHGQPGQPGDNALCMNGSYWTTTASLQLFPHCRTIRVAYSSACEAKYVELQLN